jgi:hypothetical protein
MTGRETELEYTIKKEDYVETARVYVKPDAPCGYDYALHFGTTDGYTVVRYDNSHEDQEVYDEHLCGRRYTHSKFPGITEVVDRFYEAKNLYVRWKGIEGKTP